MCPDTIPPSEDGPNIIGNCAARRRFIEAYQRAKARRKEKNDAG